MQKDAKRCKAQLGVGSEDSGPRSDTINRLMFNVLPDRTDVTMNCVHELCWIEDRLQSQEHLLLPVSVEPVEPMSLSRVGQLIDGPRRKAFTVDWPCDDQGERSKAKERNIRCPVSGIRHHITLMYNSRVLV